MAISEAEKGDYFTVIRVREKYYDSFVQKDIQKAAEYLDEMAIKKENVY